MNELNTLYKVAINGTTDVIGYFITLDEAQKAAAMDDDTYILVLVMQNGYLLGVNDAPKFELSTNK